MATRIFRVDLSEGERDFAATATEPGLAMLDRTGANSAIMQRWFGALVGEPSWQGKDAVNFFIHAEGGGRLDNVECHPATKEDLEGPLNEQLKQIQARIKRAKPEESAEVSLHRVVRSTFNKLTKDLDQSDYDCYFFKYRIGKEPWRLVWCWGFQRDDPEPAPAVICTNSECNQLFVRRPNQRPRCPGCETAASLRRPAGGFRLSARTTGLLALLLLVVAGLLVYLLGQPKLVVTPVAWDVPMGSKIEYQVHDKRWFFFNTDVTDKIVPESGDPRVIAFNRTGDAARAVGQGRTSLTFKFEDREIAATAVVKPPRTPDSLKIEGAGAELAVGATQQLRVWGEYKKGEPIDFTDLVTLWEVADPSVVYHHGKGSIEGAAEGNSTVKVSYGSNPNNKSYRSAEAAVKVVRGDYTELKVRLDPARVRRGESAKLEIVGIDAAGKEHSLSGSSLVDFNIRPASAAEIEGSYLIGRAAGKAEVQAKLGELAANFEFEVSQESIYAPGTFAVRPGSLEMAVNEYFKLQVESADTGEITAKSSNEEVVMVIPGTTSLVAVGKGEATVTVEQGGKKIEVDVTVDAAVKSLRIDPPLIALRVGQPAAARVIGTVEIGGISREIEIAPSRLRWDRLPYEYVNFDPETQVFFGLKPTSEPKSVRVLLGDELSAAGVVAVGGGIGLATLDQLGGDEFTPYPPLVPGARIAYGDLYYDRTAGGLLLDKLNEDSALYRYRRLLPPGAVITGIGDTMFDGMSEAEIRAYFAAHPEFASGDMIRYKLADGTAESFRYTLGGTVQDVGYVDARVVDQAAGEIQFTMEVYFDKLAEYRFTDNDGNPLPGEDWHTYGPQAVQRLTSPRVPLDGENSYIMHIQRKLDGNIRDFSINFSPE